MVFLFSMRTNLHSERSNAPTYREVQSLGRGLAILEALSKLGSTKPGKLSLETGIDRSSIYRLLKTLTDLGFVVSRPEDGSVSLTDRICRIADGVRGDDSITVAAGPALTTLVKKVKWPSDLALLLGGVVTIQDSTHRLSPVTVHRATIGQRRSLLGTSLGRAILAMLDADELEMALDIAGQLDPFSERRASGTEVLKIIKSIKRIGYASAEGAVDPIVSAIAVGFRSNSGVVGSINIVFFRRVMSPAQAAERYLTSLQLCAESITGSLNRLAPQSV